ncbi:hypothetical protein BH11PAT4_BH11PAT4_1900 [soil metagenome]
MKHLFAKLLLTSFCALAIFSFVPQVTTVGGASQVQAAGIIPTPGTVGETSGDRPTQAIRPDSGLDRVLDGLWNRFTRIFYMIIGIYAVITLTQASLRYGGAQGDPKKVAEARSSIIQTVLAIALLTASVTVVSIIWAFARSFV